MSFPPFNAFRRDASSMGAADPRERVEPSLRGIAPFAGPHRAAGPSVGFYGDGYDEGDEDDDDTDPIEDEFRDADQSTAMAHTEFMPRLRGRGRNDANPLAHRTLESFPSLIGKLPMADRGRSRTAQTTIDARSRRHGDDQDIDPRAFIGRYLESDSGGESCSDEGDFMLDEPLMQAIPTHNEEMGWGRNTNPARACRLGTSASRMDPPGHGRVPPRNDGVPWERTARSRPWRRSSDPQVETMLPGGHASLTTATAGPSDSGSTPPNACTRSSSSGDVCVMAWKRSAASGAERPAGPSLGRCEEPARGSEQRDAPSPDATQTQSFHLPSSSSFDPTDKDSDPPSRKRDRRHDRHRRHRRRHHRQHHHHRHREAHRRGSDDALAGADADQRKKKSDVRTTERSSKHVPVGTSESQAAARGDVDGGIASSCRSSPDPSSSSLSAFPFRDLAGKPAGGGGASAPDPRRDPAGWWDTGVRYAFTWLHHLFLERVSAMATTTLARGGVGCFAWRPYDGRLSMDAASRALALLLREWADEGTRATSAPRARGVASERDEAMREMATLAQAAERVAVDTRQAARSAASPGTTTAATAQAALAETLEAAARAMRAWTSAHGDWLRALWAHRRAVRAGTLTALRASAVVQKWVHDRASERVADCALVYAETRTAVAAEFRAPLQALRGRRHRLRGMWQRVRRAFDRHVRQGRAGDGDAGCWVVDAAAAEALDALLGQADGSDDGSELGPTTTASGLTVEDAERDARDVECVRLLKAYVRHMRHLAVARLVAGSASAAAATTRSPAPTVFGSPALSAATTRGGVLAAVPGSASATDAADGPLAQWRRQSGDGPRHDLGRRDKDRAGLVARLAETDARIRCLRSAVIGRTWTPDDLRGLAQLERDRRDTLAALSRVGIATHDPGSDGPQSDADPLRSAQTRLPDSAADTNGDRAKSKRWREGTDGDVDGTAKRSRAKRDHDRANESDPDNDDDDAWSSSSSSSSSSEESDSDDTSEDEKRAKRGSGKRGNASQSRTAVREPNGLIDSWTAALDALEAALVACEDDWLKLYERRYKREAMLDEQASITLARIMDDTYRRRDADVGRVMAAWEARQGDADRCRSQALRQARSARSLADEWLGTAERRLVHYAPSEAATAGLRLVQEFRATEALLAAAAQRAFCLVEFESAYADMAAIWDIVYRHK